MLPTRNCAFRFDREARAISSINHPHICTLFDVGQEAGLDFLVMELIDGESLADRLKKGALPVEQVLRIGSQIAMALHAAHRQGIVHRDLKPGNIMITRSGAKLLDFGLAKSAAAATTFVDSVTGMATAAKPLTHYDDHTRNTTRSRPCGEPVPGEGSRGSLADGA